MNSNKEKYKGVIIGAGAAAAGYDSPHSNEITTPAHALSVHPRTELVGFFDLDLEKTKAAAGKWCTRAFTDLTEMLVGVKPDIVCVCTPDATHAEVLKTVLKFKPKIVVTEKPLTTKLSDAIEIVGLYKDTGVPIMVNYRRRFDVAVQTIRHKIISGDYGQVLAASAFYGKGLLHGGSHMIDLGRFFFGEVLTATALARRIDYIPEDETISAFLTFAGCPVFCLLAADERQYSLFELDIVCAHSRIRLINEGLAVETQTIKSDSTELLQQGYKVLGQPIQTLTGLTTSAFGLIDNAVGYLSTGAEIIVSGEDAAKTQSVCADLARQALQIKS